MSDWIEKLRDPTKSLIVVGETYEVRLMPESLWPLLCDVVEAAEETREFGYDHGRGPLHAAIAALKAEMEK